MLLITNYVYFMNNSLKILMKNYLKEETLHNIGQKKNFITHFKLVLQH